jgi:hypothetical protein
LNLRDHAARILHFCGTENLTIQFFVWKSKISCVFSISGPFLGVLRPFWLFLASFRQAYPKKGEFQRKMKNLFFSQLKSGDG